MLMSAKSDQGRDRPTLRVFMAGPAPYRADAGSILARSTALCKAHGLKAIWPRVAPVDVAPANLDAVAQATFDTTIRRMRSCDGVVADLTPFRGPSLDANTAFVIGFAAAVGLPVVGYTAEPCEYVDRVLAFYRGRLTREGALWRDPEGFMIEDLGQTDTVMAIGALRSITRDLDQALLAFRGVFGRSTQASSSQAG